MQVLHKLWKILQQKIFKGVTCIHTYSSPFKSNLGSLNLYIHPCVAIANIAYSYRFPKQLSIIFKNIYIPTTFQT
jgi:hypothetical protein